MRMLKLMLGVTALVLAFTTLTLSATAAPFNGGEDEIVAPDCYPADEKVIGDEPLDDVEEPLYDEEEPLDEEPYAEEEPADDGGDLGFLGGPVGDDESADDKVECGDGDDDLELGEGDDEADGHDGDDVLHGGPGKDKLSGGAGNDQLYG